MNYVCYINNYTQKVSTGFGVIIYKLV